MYIVSYDISSNKLRTKVSKLLEGYGKRVQFSVFECRISEKQFQNLQKKMNILMSGKEKAGIRIYQLCGKCEEKIRTIGDISYNDNLLEDDVFII